MVKAKGKTESKIGIKPPNLQVLRTHIVGNQPYCQHKFSEKARKMMLAPQLDPTLKGKRKTAARDIDDEVGGAIHRAEDGWVGIPASAFRAAMIDSCRLVGFKMTHAKLSVFIIGDGQDNETSEALVKLESKGGMVKFETVVRLETGVAMVSVRPMWRDWEAVLRVRFDADQFSAKDVESLLMRAGLQVGIGEGRPNSKKSNGIGFGTFDVVSAELE